jgi:dTDP-4-dehydrorhamnose reductase
LPSALAEVHVHGDERERARWMLQRFDDVQAVRAEGVPVMAFGAWAAFGMIDWGSLLRRSDGLAEDGIYTYAGADGEPEPTLVCDVVRDLAAGRPVSPPAEPGWWERPPVRFCSP